MKKRQITAAVRITVVYILVGGLWILFSDRVVSYFINDPAWLTTAQTYKGWFYVLITSLLLFQLIKNNTATQENTETALREAELLYHTLIEQMPAAAYTNALDNFTNIFISPQIFSISGYTTEEWKNDPGLWERLIHPGDRQKVQKERNQSAKSGEPFDVEYRLITRDGRTIWLHDITTLIYNENKIPQYWQGLLIDITSQKNVEEAIRLSEARYHMLVEQASDAILISDTDGNLLEVNQQACTMLGYKREELLTLSLQALIPADELSLRPLKLHELHRERTIVSERIMLQKDSSPISMELNTKMLPDGNLMMIARNISSRKLAQESLARSEQRFRTLIENSRDAIALYKPDGKTVFQSPAATRILGYSQGELAGENVLKFIVEEDQEKIVHELQSLAEEPNASRIFEIRALHKDGSIRWLEVIGTNRLNEPGIEAIVANYRDITTRNQMENALRETEHRYRMLVEKIPAVVFMDIFSDPQKTQYISPRIKDLLGYTSDEWEAGDNLWEDSLHPDDKQRVLAEDIRTNETGEPFRVEYRMRHKDGHYLWIKEDASIIRGEDGSPLYWQGILVDITERKRDEEALQRQLTELTVLHSVALAESTTLNADELIQRVTNIIGEILYSDNCGVLLVNKSGDEIKPHFSYRGTNVENIDTSLPITKGISGKVATTGRPICIGDVTQEAEYYPVTSGVHSELCVPIASGDRIIGVLNVESKIQNAFTETDQRLLSTIAGSLANGIERIKLFEMEQQRREEAENLRLAATAITSTLDIKYILKEIIKALKQVAPYDSASIFLKEGEVLRVAMAQDYLDSDTVADLVFPIAEDELFQEIRKTGRPLILNDAQKDPRFKNWGGNSYIRGWMVVPLIARGEVIGGIALDSRQVAAYNESIGEQAMLFAHQAAVALENARLYTETRTRLEELQVVSRVSSALRAAHDTKEMFPLLLNEIKSSMDTETAAIWLYDKEKNELLPKAANGWFGKLPKPNFAPHEGLVGKVYASGRVHISDDFFNDPDVHHKNVQVLGKGWCGIVVPIRTASEIIGVLAAAIQTPRRISENNTRLITTIAEIAGNAIYRSNLFERTEEQIRRLTTLREMDSAIASSLDLHITLGILTDHIVAKMGASAAAILVFNPESQMLDYYATAGFKNRELQRTSLRIGDGFAGQMLLNRRAIHIKNLRKVQDQQRLGHLSGERFTSYYALPLFSKGATRGILETYFHEPFSPTDDWLDFIHTLAGQASIAIDNAQLFENLQRTNQELSLAYDTTLEGWGKALELRDKETQGHTRRVTDRALELARQMNIPESELPNIRRGALLHDIGKMGVPDRILRKEGPLTQKELAEMRRHPQYAFDLLHPIAYLRPAIDIAYCHHEWWDGSGYPRGLKGEEIPLPARIFAVVDVWDALLSNRPYRKAWTQKKTTQYINGLSGKQFDPQVVNAFMKMVEKEIEHPARDIKPARKTPRSKKKR